MIKIRTLCFVRVERISCSYCRDFYVGKVVQVVGHEYNLNRITPSCTCPDTGGIVDTCFDQSLIPITPPGTEDTTPTRQHEPETM